MGLAPRRIRHEVRGRRCAARARRDRARDSNVQPRSARSNRLLAWPRAQQCAVLVPVVSNRT